MKKFSLAWTMVLLILMSACKKDNYVGKDPYADAKEPLKIKVDKTVATPAAGSVGATVTITGSGFALYKDSGIVIKFNDVPGEITALTESSITAKVPEMGSSGLITLTVNRQVFAGPKFRVTGPVTTDLSFASVPGADKGTIHAITYVPGGKYLIGGSFEDYDNSGAKDGYRGLARINGDGTLDHDFKVGKGIEGMVFSTVVQASGKYIVAGSISNYDNRFKNGYLRNIVRLHANGMYDSTVVVTPLGNRDTVPGLNAYLDGAVAVVLQTPDSGKLVLVGGFKYFMRKNYAGISFDGKRDSVIIDSIRMEGIMRLNEDGSFDSTFNYSTARRGSYPGPNGSIANALIQDDGRIMLVGTFTNYHGQQTGGIVRLNANGELDNTFNTGSGPDDRVLTISPVTGGRYLITGMFGKINGTESRKVAVLNADGSLYNGFSVGIGANAGPAGFINTAIQLKNGKIFLSGYFDAFSGVKRGGTVILDEDGKLSKGYNSMGSLGGTITRMLNVPNSNATIMVGSFSQYDLLTLNSIMLLRY
ncbi:DUF5008 domain-containing protein [Chitinophaga sp. MM2321]|uniref:DUF5008 domain-containing protein n=1 Tax=Chitinophaga sp. MM2321 TaxID=3137178 RepID=UPI0032D584C6